MKPFFYFVFITLVFFNTSCITKKPYAEKISPPDYNQRIIVEKPSYIKKENTLGISISIGTTALGGYLGYKYGPIRTVNTNKPEIAQAGNSILGALLGYSFSRLVSNILGKDKIKNPVDKNDWLKKLQGNYILINPIPTGDTWELIKKSSETNFIVKEFNDVLDFHSAFPNSPYYENMLSNTFNKIERQEIPKLLKLFPNTNQKNEFQSLYFESSANVGELKKAVEFFPEAKEKFNECLVIGNLINNASKADLVYMLKEFTNSPCSSKIKNKLISGLKTINECIKIVKQFSLLQIEAGNKAYYLAETINDYKTVAINFPSLRTKAFTQAEYLRKKAFEQAEKLKKENAYKAFLDEQIEHIANEAGNNIMNKTSDRGTGRSLNVKVNDYKIDEDNITIMMEVSWMANLITPLGTVLNPFSILDGGKRVTCWAKGQLKVDLSDNTMNFIDRERNDAFSKSADWAKSRILYIGTIALVSYATWERTKWTAKQYKDDPENNSPCYEEVNDYGYLIDSTKRYYKIRCRNGKEKRINYNSKFSKPFSLDSNFLMSYKTLEQAAKAACNCRK